MVEFDECAEFRSVVDNVELIVSESDLGMDSWDWDVTHSDLTLMSSSQFDDIILICCD